MDIDIYGYGTSKYVNKMFITILNYYNIWFQLFSDKIYSKMMLSYFLITSCIKNIALKTL